MAFDIIIGRTDEETQKYGKKGSIFLGKQYVEMGETTSLSNEVYLDVASSHVVFVCGKRGSGKSYTMGVMAEGMANLPDNVRQNLSFILMDTMGVYWTMKYPNRQDTELLKEWGIEPQQMNEAVKIFTPSGFYEEYKEKDIPTDAPFAIKPSDLNAEDWSMTFDIDPNSPEGILISRTLHKLKDQGKNYSIQELIKTIKEDEQSDKNTRNTVINHLHRVDDWGIFSKEGTKVEELAKGGQVTVIDMSPYATLPNGWLIKSLVTSLISEKLFTQRMIARKEEEYESVDEAMHYFSKENQERLDEPLVWLVLDEAHELLPEEGKTAATDSLVTLLREGRQPGISLILASQQPGKIHTDVLTQSDTVISHRLTAQVDVKALGKLTQTYMEEGITNKLNHLPRTPGAALIFDDTNERMFPIKVRPRMTWHGGAAPTALVDEQKFKPPENKEEQEKIKEL